MFKTIHHFFFYQVQCLLFHVKVFGTFGLKLSAEWLVGSICIILYAAIQSDVQHLLKTPFFHYISGLFIKNQLYIGVWIYSLVFNSSPLIKVFFYVMLVFIIKIYFFYYCSFVVQLKIGNDENSNSSFIGQDFFKCPEFS